MNDVPSEDDVVAQSQVVNEAPDDSAEQEVETGTEETVQDTADEHTEG